MIKRYIKKLFKDHSISKLQFCGLYSKMIVKIYFSSLGKWIKKMYDSSCTAQIVVQSNALQNENAPPPKTYRLGLLFCFGLKVLLDVLHPTLLFQKKVHLLGLLLMQL